MYHKTEEREAHRKHGLDEKTAASVLLKLFIINISYKISKNTINTN